MSRLIDVQTRELPKNLLVDRFIVPPFTILYTTKDYWLNRRADWLRLGIKGEVGRTTGTFTRSQSDKDLMSESGAKKFGRTAQQVSIFDPVLCEISYKWFSRRGDVILDPFAGGPVRGVIASALDRDYYGIDLRQEQVQVNRDNYAEITSRYDLRPVNWIVGDSREADMPKSVNMIFTCPPYFNLEVYSDSDADLSNMASYEDFIKNYYWIIDRACARLEEDSFAVFVVGNIRDKKTGEYHDLVGDTIRAFQKFGLQFYNEAVIVLSPGSIPIRATQHFNISRKFERQHANYLIFYKGNPKNIREKFGVFDNSVEVM